GTDASIMVVESPPEPTSPPVAPVPGELPPVPGPPPLVAAALPPVPLAVPLSLEPQPMSAPIGKARTAPTAALFNETLLSTLPPSRRPLNPRVRAKLPPPYMYDAARGSVAESPYSYPTEECRRAAPGRTPRPSRSGKGYPREPRRERRLPQIDAD